MRLRIVEFGRMNNRGHQTFRDTTTWWSRATNIKTTRDERTHFRSGSFVTDTNHRKRAFTNNTREFADASTVATTHTIDFIHNDDTTPTYKTRTRCFLKPPTHRCRRALIARIEFYNSVVAGCGDKMRERSFSYARRPGDKSGAWRSHCDCPSIEPRH